MRRIPVLLVVAFWLLPLTAPAQVPLEPIALVVQLPQPDAELLIDGKTTKATGAERRFLSPPVPLGREYTYTLVATWMPTNYETFTRTRRVTVQAGRDNVVDLRQPNPKEKDKLFIRFVPTPEEVVEAMCKLAGVGKDDVVFDLGCGDGRIVITAVSKFGARRGVGVDLDPDRIKESKDNARDAKVEDQVEFRMADVLDLKDLSEATVVMLYMSDDLNLKLRPILQKALKPGSRIVSHRFTMGDWKPLKTETIEDGTGEQYQILLWKVGQ